MRYTTLGLRDHQNICHGYGDDLACTTCNLPVVSYSNAYLWRCYQFSCTVVLRKLLKLLHSNSVLIDIRRLDAVCAALLIPWDVFAPVFNTLTATESAREITGIGQKLWKIPGGILDVFSGILFSLY